jgi:integrase
VRRILDASRGTVHYVPLLLAATAGLRRGEVLAIGWDDVDLERGRVTVRRSLILRDGRPEMAEPKTPRARRQVELMSSMVTILRTHRR